MNVVPAALHTPAWVRAAPRKALMHLAGRDSGQNVVEYGLLIASIVVIVLIGITTFGHLIQPWFIALAGRITSVGT
jgi:Flp pilus assembly pilin Flp